MNVLVLSGGISAERDVSLRSGKAVADALGSSGHTVSVYDPKDGESGLLQAAQTVDVVFPALHGVGGEDGVIQGLLEANHIPCVGSDSTASQLCFHKQHYKDFLHQHGILMPSGELISETTFDTSVFSKAPFIIKPVDGGSTIDAFIVRDVTNYDYVAITSALRRYGQMLIEQLVTGVEITVGVLDDQPLPVIEIIPPENQEFDYENKYNGATQELCPPAHVSVRLQQQAQQLAGNIHRLTGCRGMSRTDIIIDEQDKLWVLETNTIPGLTDQSLYPKAARTAGVDMPELVDRLVRSATA